MLPPMDHNRPLESKRSRAPSSLDQWLERAQRAGSSYVDPSGLRYGFPDWQGSHAANLRSPEPSAQSRPGRYSRHDENEGLMFMQAHYNHLLAPPAAPPISVPVTTAAHPSFAYGGLHNSSLFGRDASFAVPSGHSSSGPLSAGVEPWGLHEPYDLSQLHASGYARTGLSNAAAMAVAVTGGGAASTAEAEQYIARLEEEVQLLMVEVSERDRRIVAVSAVKDAMAVQLQEMRRRADLVGEEGGARLGHHYAFQRTLAFQRALEERARAMEVSTQLSVLKHELKLSEAMLAQAQSSVATAATHQQQQLRLLSQRSEEDNGIARSVTATVRTLLQEEYGRLAELVTAETPKKASRDTTASTSGGAEAARGEEGSSAVTTVEQRKLERLLESLIASRLTAPVAPASALAAGAPLGAAPPSPLPLVLGDGEAAQLVRLAYRVCRHHTALLELYNAEVDRKAALAQYENDLARLIHEKQGALTWAALYQEKKDEVKHLNEQLMSLRGELRAARGNAGRGVGGMPSAVSVAGSTLSTQSYEAYASPYVPPRVRSPRQATDRREGSSASATQQRPGAARATRKPIGELREEARRLGALPATHVPPLVTSRSPSIDSFYNMNSPPAAEAAPLVDSSSSEPAKAIVSTLPPPPPVPLAAAPASKASASQASPTQPPLVPLIRAFAPKAAGGSSSSSEVPVRRSAAKVESPVAVRKGDTRQSAKRAAETPARAASRKTRAASRPSSSSSTASSEVLPATRTQLNKSALRRVSAATATSATKASRAVARSASASTSLSSEAAASGASSLSRAAAKWSAAKRASSAGAAVKPAARHNSFDDDGDEDDESGAKPGMAGRRGGKVAPASTTTRAAAASTPTTISKVSDVKAGSRGATSTKATAAVGVQRKPANVRHGAGKDEDTSSLSLSMSSRSSASPPARLRGASAKKKAEEAGSKARHARKSSFDDDEASGGGGADGSSTTSSRSDSAPAPSRSAAATARAPRSTPAPAAAAKPATTSTTTAKMTTAASAAGAKLSKLKLPSW